MIKCFKYDKIFLYIILIYLDYNEIKILIEITCIPGPVKYSAILIKSDEFIRASDHMQITMLAVVEICVGLPNSRQHRNTQSECFLTTLKC